MKTAGSLSGKGKRYVEVAREHPGWTAKRVREETGLSPSGAQRLRRFYGLENRQAREGTHLRLPALSLRTRVAADLVARGRSRSEAARLLEVSRQAVQQAVKRVQKRRGQGQAPKGEP